MDYSYEIFISYRGRLAEGSPCDPGEFVQEALYPELMRVFPREIGTTPRIFCDVQTTGQPNWQRHLLESLRGSRLMLAVWSADYFSKSRWCMAEWETFHARQTQVDTRLVEGIAFNSSRFFDPRANENGHTDFNPVNWARKDRSGKYLQEFVPQVEQLVRRLTDLIRTAPASPDSSWPAVGPDEVQLLARDPFNLRRAP